MENNLQTRAGFVTLLGAPNAGKSTVANHFAGSKVSIVTSKAQTTRSIIKSIGVFHQTQIIFLDTPGIFRPTRRLDRAMVTAAWESVKDSDKIVLVVDMKRGLDDETKEIIGRLKENRLSAVLLLNKKDLVSTARMEEIKNQLDTLFDFEKTFFVSAETGQGMDDFYGYLAEHLPLSPFLYPEDEMSDLPLKFAASEVVREKLFTFLHDELPYDLTVEPELWKRQKDGSVRAEMTIYVKRDNQKIIVLGRGGQMIKKIGQTARQELEEMFDDRIHLFLFVKVRPNWENDPARYQPWGLRYNV